MNDSSPIGVAELAARLRLPIRWIKAEAKAGRLPHLRAGRHWLFNKQALLTHLTDRASREGVTRAE
jgi:excisionase family DNA binding protein